MLCKHRILPRVALLALVTLLPACAGTVTPDQAAEMEAANDPWEPMNRRSLDTNYFLDRLFFRPLAELYRVTVPPPLRDRVAGIVGNLKEPVIFANNLLQGEFDKAGTTFERFAINSTAGLGGMWDLAGGWGMPRQTGDFGQTLAVWGVDEGPYLMLPVFGPSNVRDAVGLVVDLGMSPWPYLAYNDSPSTLVRYELASIGADALVKRERNIESIDALRAGSLDVYVEMRSAYRQYRNRQIGTAPEEKPPEFENYE